MGLETGSYLSDLVTTNPTATDPAHQGDDHIRLIKSVLRTTFPNASKAFRFFESVTKTSNYTVLSTDEHKFLIGNGGSASVTFTLPSLSSSDAGWWAIFMASDTTNMVRIQPTSGTINGASYITFTVAYQHTLVWWNGSAWYAMVDKTTEIHANSALTAPAADDEVLIYDTSAGANFRITLTDLLKVVNAFTSKTTLVTDDTLLLYDSAASTVKKVSMSDLMKIINAFSALTTIDTGADYIPIYDASAASVKKVTVDSILAPISGYYKLDQVDVSSPVSYVSFTIPSGYIDCRVLLHGVLPSTDTYLYARLANSGGLITSGYNYAGWGVGTNGGYGGLGSNADTGFALTGNSALTNYHLSSTSGYGLNGEFILHDPSLSMGSARRPSARWATTWLSVGQSVCSLTGGGFLTTITDAVTSVRFVPGSGFVVDGQFTLYGAKG